MTRHLREKYVYALLHHDIAYVESEKPGKLGQTVAEESSRIINGLGPSIGQFVRAIATFLSGLIIGFTHVSFMNFTNYRVGNSLSLLSSLHPWSF